MKFEDRAVCRLGLAMCDQGHADRFALSLHIAAIRFKVRPHAKEDDMPPLTTPASALLFMMAFFILIAEVPVWFAKHGRH